MLDPDQPDLRPIPPHVRLCAGIEVGWLFLLHVPDLPHQRIEATCRCGHRVTPLLAHVATGRVRNCGRTSVHVRLQAAV